MNMLKKLLLILLVVSLFSGCSDVQKSKLSNNTRLSESFIEENHYAYSKDKEELPQLRRFRNDNYGYLGRDGHVVINAIFFDKSSHSDYNGVIVADGFMDSSGTAKRFLVDGEGVILSRGFKALNYWSDELFIGIDYEENMEYLVNDTGEIVYEGEVGFYSNFHFPENFLTYHNPNSYYNPESYITFLDENLDVKELNINVTSVLEIYNNYALVIYKESDKYNTTLIDRYAYIDIEGNIIIGPYDYIDSWGEPEGIFAVYENDKYYFVDENNEKIIGYGFEDAYNFSEGRAQIDSDGDGLYGYIDTKGNYIVDELYFETEAYSEGYAVVVGELLETESKYDSAYYVLDRNGLKINQADPKIQEINSYSNGMALVWYGSMLDSVAGYWDYEGNVLIPYTFNDASSFKNELADVSLNGIDFTIDLLGNRVGTDNNGHLLTLEEKTDATFSNAKNIKGSLYDRCDYEEYDNLITFTPLDYYESMFVLDQSNIEEMITVFDNKKVDVRTTILNFKGSVEAFKTRHKFHLVVFEEEFGIEFDLVRGDENSGFYETLYNGYTLQYEYFMHDGDEWIINFYIYTDSGVKG